MFCRCGRVQRYWRAHGSGLGHFHRGCGGVALLAGVVCCEGFPIGEAVALARGACGGGFSFLVGLWLGLFGGVCFCRPLVYVCFFLPFGAFLGLCWVTRKQTIPSLNDLSKLFEC